MAKKKPTNRVKDKVNQQNGRKSKISEGKFEEEEKEVTDVESDDEFQFEEEPDDDDEMIEDDDDDDGEVDDDGDDGDDVEGDRDEEEEKDKKCDPVIPKESILSRIKNKIRRRQLYEKYLKEKNEGKKAERLRRLKEAEMLGDDAPPKQVPRTIEKYKRARWDNRQGRWWRSERGREVSMSFHHTSGVNENRKCWLQPLKNLGRRRRDSVVSYSKPFRTQSSDGGITLASRKCVDHVTVGATRTSWSSTKIVVNRTPC